MSQQLTSSTPPKHHEDLPVVAFAGSASSLPCLARPASSTLFLSLESLGRPGMLIPLAFLIP